MTHFDKLDNSLRVLTERAIIRDRITHLEIAIDEDDWGNGDNYAFTMANLSMQFSRPILFTNRNRTTNVWWTNGARFNPNGPSIRISISGNMYEKYTNENGMTHREDGPAVVKDMDGKYMEEWMVSPGKLHRVDGPASIHLDNASPHFKPWKDCLKLEDARWFRWVPKRFQEEQPVQHYVNRQQDWFQHGRPKRGNKLPTSIYDQGVFIVTIITPTLIPYTYTYIRRREYRWLDEDGRLDRSDGPAIVCVNNLKMEDFGHEQLSLRYSNSSTRWYYKGSSLNEYKREEWMKKNGIKLIDGLPVEKSAFVKEDDEFCFLADYLPHVEDVGSPF